MTTVALVGAGSMVFTRQVVSDLLRVPELREGLTLSLVDTDGRRLDAARDLTIHLVGEAGARAEVRASLDRASGIAGADFVVTTIQVGGYAATRADFDIPASYGLRQTIADTVGVGGIFRGLRTLPVILEICRDMEGLAPGARLLNYTNPMGMVMLAVSSLTAVEGYGLCHSVPHTADALASYLGVAPERLGYLAAGVNHQAWFLSLTVDGRDAYPDLARAAHRPDVRARDPVRFELMDRLGVFVSESSEHNAEYLPYFMRSEAEVARLGIPVGEYLRRSEANMERFDRLADLLASGEPLLLPPSDEYAPRLVEALVSGREALLQVNVHNGPGYIENLPRDSAVEVPVRAGGRGVEPQAVGPLPTALAALNLAATTAQQLVVEAVRTGHREPVEEAVMLDPNAAASLTLDAMVRMVDDLLRVHGGLVPPLARRRLWTVDAGSA
jgi:alpha-galactosidase